MNRVVILPDAKRDIREAALWYNKKQAGLGKRFIDQVRRTVKFIKKNPKACSIRYKSTRTVVLNIFPFMLHYIFDEENKIVTIIAVLHTSRNPELWNKR